MLGKLISKGNTDQERRSPRTTKFLQRFFLARLRRMVDARREQAPLLDAGSPDLRLLDKAVYSTYCDCLDLGSGKEARAILRQEDVAAIEDKPCPDHSDRSLEEPT